MSDATLGSAAPGSGIALLEHVNINVPAHDYATVSNTAALLSCSLLSSVLFRSSLFEMV